MFKTLLRCLYRTPVTMMKPDKIVVGLGNPGNQYKGTRHNAGYMILAELASRHGRGKPCKQFQADVVEAQIKGQNVLLLCPVTYMNLSGRTVGEVVRFYKLLPEQIVVACDDMDLPVGKIRVRAEGGSGGQKGLADIIQKLGTKEFTRIRVGIGHPTGSMDVADYVLSSFAKSEKVEIDLAVKNAADAIECWLENGNAATMNRFN